MPADFFLEPTKGVEGMLDSLGKPLDEAVFVFDPASVSAIEANGHCDTASSSAADGLRTASAEKESSQSKLECLRLSGTRLGKSAAIAIAKWLADPNIGLKTLDISKNELCGKRVEQTFSPEHVFSLCDVLKSRNSTITCLNFSKCDIGARSTRHLMEALKVNKVISTVIMDDCNCSEEGKQSGGRERVTCTTLLCSMLAMLPAHC